MGFSRRMYRPTSQCRDLDRVGDVGDGGKWICGIHDKLDHRRIVYSAGSNYQVSGRGHSHGHCDDVTYHVDYLHTYINATIDKA